MNPSDFKKDFNWPEYPLTVSDLTFDVIVAMTQSAAVSAWSKLNTCCKWRFLTGSYKTQMRLTKDPCAGLRSPFCIPLGRMPRCMRPGHQVSTPVCKATFNLFCACLHMMRRGHLGPQVSPPVSHATFVTSRTPRTVSPSLRLCESPPFPLPA